MKNKTTTYFLIAGVLIVWGLIFYRVLSGINSSDKEFYVNPKKVVIQSSHEEEEGVLILTGNYRDPFLGGTERAMVGADFSGKSNQNVKSKNRGSKTEIDWSFIDYIGIVTNKDTKKKVGLLSISGKEYMVNEKDNIEGITIIKKDRDSILISYIGNKKWIRR